MGEGKVDNGVVDVKLAGKVDDGVVDVKFDGKVDDGVVEVKLAGKVDEGVVDEDLGLEVAVVVDNSEIKLHLFPGVLMIFKLLVLLSDDKNKFWRVPVGVEEWGNIDIDKVVKNIYAHAFN